MPMDDPDLIRQLKSPKPIWSGILKRVREHPSEVRYIDQVTGQTALHLAIERRSTSQSRIQAIAAMLAWYPGATVVRCQQKGYTPLDKVAASRTENELILESDAKVVELLIRSNTKDLINARSNQERLSPLSLHVKSMSMLQSRIQTSQSKRSGSPSHERDKKQQLHRASKIVLGAIAPHCSLETLTEALETLYICNSLIIMDMVSQEERRSRHNVTLDFGRQSRGRSAAGHWIWEWLLDLLAVLHTRTAQGAFHALHLLSSIPNCPPAFLLLAMRAYPYDIRTPDPRTGNLPLHNVSAWPNDANHSNVRKYMCLESLSATHESGLAFPNALGKTPVDLDNEAGTNLLDMGVSGHDRSGGGDDDDDDDEEEEDHGDDEEGEENEEHSEESSGGSFMGTEDDDSAPERQYRNL